MSRRSKEALQDLMRNPSYAAGINAQTAARAKTQADYDASPEGQQARKSQAVLAAEAAKKYAASPEGIAAEQERVRGNEERAWNERVTKEAGYNPNIESAEVAGRRLQLKDNGYEVLDIPQAKKDAKKAGDIKRDASGEPIYDAAGNLEYYAESEIGASETKGSLSPGSYPITKEEASKFSVPEGYSVVYKDGAISVVPTEILPVFSMTEDQIRALPPETAKYIGQVVTRDNPRSGVQGPMQDIQKYVSEAHPTEFQQGADIGTAQYSGPGTNFTQFRDALEGAGANVASGVGAFLAAPFGPLAQAGAAAAGDWLADQTSTGAQKYIDPGLQAVTGIAGGMAGYGAQNPGSIDQIDPVTGEAINPSTGLPPGEQGVDFQPTPGKWNDVTGAGTDLTAYGAGTSGTAGAFESGVAGGTAAAGVPDYVPPVVPDDLHTAPPTGGFFDNGNWIPTTVGAGLTIAGANEASDAANEAARLGAEATGKAIDESKRQFDIGQENLAPWLAAGKSALTEQQNLMGLNGDSSSSLASLQSSPGFQFRLKTGRQGLDASSAARGGMGSGKAATAASGWNQEFASDEYGKRLNQLAGLSGAGQTTGTTLANQGANFAGKQSDLLTGLAGYQGSAGMAGANARQSGLYGLANLGINAWDKYRNK